MNNLTYTLKADEEFITLPKLLKILDLIGSGGEIRYHIENESILYNGEVEYRKRKKCFKGDEITFENNVLITIL